MPFDNGEATQTLFDGVKESLIKILDFVRTLLEELLPSLTEDRPLFESAWKNEVKPDLERLITSVRDMGEGDQTWQDFKQRGLTGEQLKLKAARLAAASRKGLRGRILEIINTILGSIPGPDPIKEFKELTEEGLDDPNATVSASFT